jgi:hypothetical protein
MPGKVSQKWTFNAGRGKPVPLGIIALGKDVEHAEAPAEEGDGRRQQERIIDPSEG